MDIGFLDGDAASRAVFEGVAEAGFDYVELPFYALSACVKIDELKKTLRGAGLRCLACNIFFPSEIKLVGRDMDKPAIIKYLERMLPFAADLGVETLVFGNGGARRIPDGETRETVWGNLRWIVEKMDGYAGANGIRIAVEPLNAAETNMILSYTEAVDLTRGLTNAAAMIDTYHTLAEGRNYDDVLVYPDRLWHLHTAYSSKRFVPSPDDEAGWLGDLVKIIKSTGYDDKISIEGNLRAQADVKGALTALKKEMNG